MTDREKVIECLEKSKMVIEKWVPIFEQYNTPSGIDDAIALLKEQDTREQCLKTKCIICPHCDNCDVDENGLLKEQEPEAKWIYGEDETGVDGWHCSECNFFEPWFYEFTEDIDFIRFYGHCPKCGRRMTSYTGKPTQERR